MNARRHFDVFNGDADGLCALHQLRLAFPQAATLVTGVKREVDLLQRVCAAAGDSVTVLDVSLETNRAALMHLLAQGVEVEYFDHHYAGAIPSHPRLHAAIDTSPEVCTSLIVDRYLAGRYRIWAIVAAFGDNLQPQAEALARTLALDDRQIAQLRALGESLNYNAYGEREADLLIAPAILYGKLQGFVDPFEFVRAEPIVHTIGEGRREDMARARDLEPEVMFPCGAIYLLPDEGWSRRVRGAFVNELATASPRCAHAVLSPNADGGYTVSVRAPFVTLRGAERLCRQFPGGNGRSAAAGINHLPPSLLPEFTRAFEHVFAAQD